MGCPKGIPIDAVMDCIGISGTQRMATKHQIRHLRQTDVFVFRSLFTVLQLFPPIASQVAFHRFFRPRKSRPLTIKDLITHDIVLRGQKVRVYEGGQGPGVFVMHGWESSVSRLARLISTLIANDFRVVTFDMPAHGNSPGRDTDILQITDFIIHLAETTGPFTAAIGHSFGGICLANAIKGNLCVDRLVLVSTPPNLVGMIETYCQMLGIWRPTKIRLIRAIEERLGTLELESEFDIRPMLQRSGIPTLIIHDRKDPVVPFSAAEELSRCLANVLLFQTDTLGHSKIVRDVRTIDKCIKFISQSETPWVY